ncbi:hypothetical protein SLEP1_g48182 [Rubroshorea leprosula]|uniref:Uncharacterized protein n=1 Tax=Rubroshorea leprosula TaxID=152421 RepID=A0AAV5LST9_9ROSI|nr:hypothetical protein SLEP1_g48182 [Rubroshorea leprosula]
MVSSKSSMLDSLLCWSFLKLLVIFPHQLSPFSFPYQQIVTIRHCLLLFGFEKLKSLLDSLLCLSPCDVVLTTVILWFYCLEFVMAKMLFLRSGFEKG